MTENIKPKIEEEEEEEEEEEDSVIDIRHRKFVYKVRSIQSPDHPTTSFHMTQQNTSPLSTNSSYTMKMNEIIGTTTTTETQITDSNKYSTNESLFPQNTELQISSVINNIQQNHLPTITFNEPTEQFLSSFETTHSDVLNYENEHHLEQMINFDQSIQQLNESYGDQFLNETTFNGSDYNFNHEFGTSSTISKDFETNETDIIHDDEIVSDILQQGNNNISRIQHGPLFGCAATENLFNFTISGFDLLETNDADNVNLSVTDNDCSGQRIIMGLTNDGYVIIDGLSIPINKKVNNMNQQNESNISFSTMNTNERNISLSMSQIPEDLNEKQRSVKNTNSSNEIVTGLTAHGELIIANTTDNCSWITAQLVSVIMGLTSTGQIICGGCISDTIPGNIEMKCEKIIESNEQHATAFNIIVKADIHIAEIITEKNDSYENESNHTSLAINSSISNIIRTLDSQEWSQADVNTTSLLNFVNDHAIKQNVFPTEPTKTTINDNFEDLKGRISMETLDLIKRLHMQYFNIENPEKQSEFSSFDNSKSKKQEIIRVSGKLEIL
ncbi:unnamed protein product [Acanthocheilonema viteae]|uniref:Uncharacterized protein n=1 Tax=Acanthocheilonema viteae TaxID=6277 RepID=A0A498SIL2_ACAVI|nr:unnamed protein product [Acanthocheilonema viteae]